MASREAVREARLGDVWSNDLNDVFADVAPYYDRANNIAALGQFGNFLRRFMQLVELKPQQKVLDVCAGTNAIGIALLKREPTLDVHAIDRSAAMQTVGQQRAAALGFNIKSTIGDVHKLPFPDRHFDIVTLQFASRHLRVREVFGEILRVLKPGGHFSISDVVLRGELPEQLQHAAEMYAGCVSGALQESEYLGIIHDLGFEQVTVQKRKPIVLPDDILSNYMDAEQIAAYKASGTGILSITAAASKPSTGGAADNAKAACCAPNAEGTEKVKVSTGETCGCGIDSTCC